MKFLLAIFLIFLTGSLISGLISRGILTVSAYKEIDPVKQGFRSPTCCQIKHKFEIKSEIFQKGDVLMMPECNLIDPPDYCYCPITEVFGHFGEIYPTPFWAGICTLDAIASIADVIRWIIMIITGIAIVFGAIMFVTAGGEPGRIEKAKKVLFYSLIGILIAIGAKFVPSVARYFIGI